MMTHRYRISKKNLSVSFVAIFISFSFFQIISCTNFVHTYKVKKNSGVINFNYVDSTNGKDVFTNSILRNPTTLSNLLKNNYTDPNNKFHIFLLNENDNSVIEASSSYGNSDSIVLTTTRINKKQNISAHFEIIFSGRDINPHELTQKNSSSFDLTFITDTITHISPIFSITKFTPFVFNDTKFQLLTGVINNQYDNYNFIILNDPAPVTIPIKMACILTFCKDWETICYTQADNIAAKRKVQCKYRVRYKNFDWLICKKEVFCEIECP